MKLVVMIKYNKGLKVLLCCCKAAFCMELEKAEVVLSSSDLKLSVCEKVN